MDLKISKQYLNGNYQQCPECKNLCFIPSLGCGFHKCPQCKTIFCIYCCEEQVDEHHALAHFLSCHFTKDDTFETKNLEEIAKGLDVLSIEFRVGTLCEKILIQKKETIKTLFLKYRKTLRNDQPIIYRMRYQYNNQLLNESSTIERYGMQNNSQIIYSNRRILGLTIQIPRPIVEIIRINQKPFQLVLTDIGMENKLQLYLSKKFGYENEEKLYLFQNGDIIPQETNLIAMNNSLCVHPIWVITNEEYGQAVHLAQFIEPFQELFRLQEHCDFTLSGIGVHSSMLKLRTNLEPQYIKTHLEKVSLNQEWYQDFAEWVYGRDYKRLNKESVKECLRILGLDPEQVPTFEQQLTKKFKSNQIQGEMDFQIIVLDSEDPEEVDIINVNKIVLQARSGLYRNMFNSVQEEISQVQDYSGRSLDTIKTLIQFFYTGILEITADMQIDEIVEELEDAQEYYLIEPKISFEHSLSNLKKKYGKN
ncbi:hypothetical protein M0813_13523 [Anaeramoeba flamelloides]|uniref:BTB domain-containing protein n=1 Tax=Anaeramoeba flamelloides TaxID=1746091 RepID=A0ABQ8Z819_9EUKA|nr:hypothetical protein M0813_13523 [Anaeramoeba flamelloides]